MNISDLGNLGEFVGALAVLASLVYLAIQIRANTKTVRASMFQSITSSWLTQVRFIASDPSLSDLIDRSASQPHSLDQADLTRLWLVTRANFRQCENDHYQFSSGTFDEEAWTGYQNSIVQEILGTPAFRAMWRLQRGGFSTGFVRFMDAQARVAEEREQRSEVEGIEQQWRGALEESGIAEGGVGS